jgi:hypothetical protein
MRKFLDECLGSIPLISTVCVWLCFSLMFVTFNTEERGQNISIPRHNVPLPLSAHPRPLCSKLHTLFKTSSLVACIQHCQIKVISLYWVTVSEYLMFGKGHMSHGAKLSK